MTDHNYHCETCGQPIIGNDTNERHSLPTGEDCHANCCPACAEEFATWRNITHDLYKALAVGEQNKQTTDAISNYIRLKDNRY